MGDVEGAVDHADDVGSLALGSCLDVDEVDPAADDAEVAGGQGDVLVEGPYLPALA